MALQPAVGFGMVPSRPASARHHRFYSIRLMNLTVSNVLAMLAIIFVIITYLVAVPLLPVAIILVALAVIFR